MGIRISQAVLRKYLQYAEGNDQIPLSARRSTGEGDHVELSIGDMEMNCWKMSQLLLEGILDLLGSIPLLGKSLLR